MNFPTFTTQERGKENGYEEFEGSDGSDVSGGFEGAYCSGPHSQGIDDSRERYCPFCGVNREGIDDSRERYCPFCGVNREGILQGVKKLENQKVSDEVWATVNAALAPLADYRTSAGTVELVVRKSGGGRKKKVAVAV